MTHNNQTIRHVYISYHARQDRIARKINEELKEFGILPLLWEEGDNPINHNGCDIIIERNSTFITTAAVFCCIISPSYQSCLRCKGELHIAVKSEIPVIPVYVKRDWRPSGWLSDILSKFLWIDFRYTEKVEIFTRSMKSLIQELLYQGGECILPSSEHSSQIPQARCLKHARNSKYLSARKTSDNEETIVLVNTQTQSCYWRVNIGSDGITLRNVATKEYLSLDTRDEEPIVCSVAKCLAASNWSPVQDVNNFNGERAVLLQHARTGLLLSADADDQIDVVKNYSKSCVWYITS